MIFLSSIFSFYKQNMYQNFSLYPHESYFHLSYILFMSICNILCVISSDRSGIHTHECWWINPCPLGGITQSCVFHPVSEFPQKHQVPFTHVVDDLKCNIYWLPFLPFHTSPIFQHFLKSSPRSSVAFKSLSYILLWGNPI